MPADLSTLINDLSAADARLRIAAAERLARSAEPQGAAVALVRATADSEEQVRELAVSALEEMGPPATGDLEALARLLESPASDAAYWSATLLGRCGPAAGSAAQALGRLLSNGNAPAAARQRAAWALGKIGPAAGAARGALQQAAGSDDPRLARLSRAALDKLAT